MNKYLVVKRALDLIIATMLLVILAIPMIFIAIVIKVYNDGPVIYKSKRIGKNMKPFYSKIVNNLAKGCFTVFLLQNTFIRKLHIDKYINGKIKFNHR